MLEANGNFMSKSQIAIVIFTAAVTVWGATAYQYMNTGFSIAMIVFGLYLIYTLIKKDWPKEIVLDWYMLVGMAILYASLIVVALCHLDNLKNFYGGYFSAWGFIQYTFPLWMLIYIGWTHDIRKTILVTLYVILYVLCIYGLYHYFHDHQQRLSSFYFFPTRIGMMMDMFIPFTVGLGIYYRKNRKIVVFTVVLVILESACFYFAKVRGSYGAFAAAAVLCVLVYLALNYKKINGPQLASIVVSVLLMLGCMGAFMVGTGKSEKEMLQGGERLLMWEASYKMWQDHPVTGIGLDEWKKTYESDTYRPPKAREIGHIMPHNVFIYFFTTGGTIAGAAYILYCLLIFAWLVRENKRHPTPVGMAMLFLFIAGTAHGMVDQTFILKLTGRIYYMLLGAGIVYQRWTKLLEEK